MIPRLMTSRRTVRLGRKNASAFQRGKDERPLRMFIDDASLDAEDLAASIVRGFVGHPLLDVYTTSATADPRLEVERVEGEYPNDAAHVHTIGQRQDGVSFVRHASQKAARARRYATQSTDVAELTRRVILVDHAELDGSDAFVTSSPELHAMAKDGAYAGVNIMSPGAAVALAGLFLRLRQDFAYLHSGTSSASYGKRGFYGLLAQDLLPSSQRWLAVCPQGEAWQSSPFRLAESVLVRVERALYARDHIHEHLLIPQKLDGDDDTLFYLDAFLYSLAGAFDAIARVVHAACGMESSARRANWRDRKKKENWMAELATKAPQLAAIMAAGKPHREALEFIFVLRNWVHAEALSSVPLITDADRLDLVLHPLLLPPDDTGILVNTIKVLGGLEAWGVQQIDVSSYAMDIASFVENVLPRALAAMDEMMTLTPVESLPDATPSRSYAPLDARATMAVERLRLLSGLR